MGIWAEMFKRRKPLIRSGRFLKSLTRANIRTFSMSQVSPSGTSRIPEGFWRVREKFGYQICHSASIPSPRTGLMEVLFERCYSATKFRANELRRETYTFEKQRQTVRPASE